MRTLLSLLSFVLVLQLAWGPLASASNIQFSRSSSGANGSISGEAAFTKVGNLHRKGSAAIADNTISMILEGDVTQKPALTGQAFKTHKTGSGNETRIKGFAWFNGGSALNELPNRQDTIHTTTGTSYTGHITSISDDRITIETSSGKEAVDTSSVESFDSPRVFSFTLKETSSGGSNEIVFTQTTSSGSAQTRTSQHRPSSVKATSNTGGEHNTAKRIVVCVVLGCLIATAIAVPIAVCCATRGHSNNGANQLALFNLIRARQVQAAQAQAQALALAQSQAQATVRVSSSIASSP